MIKIEEKENILFLDLIISGQLMDTISFPHLALRFTLPLMHILDVLYGYMLEFLIVRPYLWYASFFK
jgi:hypothetical protein